VWPLRCVTHDLTKKLLSVQLEIRTTVSTKFKLVTSHSSNYMTEERTNIPAKEALRSYKMDFLSSSEDEESVGSEDDLVDSSSDDGKRIAPKIISDISSVLGKVKIGGEEKTAQRKSSAICKKSEIFDDDSSDDSFLDSYKPAFASTPRKTVALAMSDSEDSTTVKTSRSRWRRSVLSKEYTITDTTSSDAPNFRIPSLLFDRMYEHQKEGVAWMVGLHAEALGGLLAVSMVHIHP